MVRVLIVDDFRPFRRVVCSMLLKTAALQIVGEASDGLEAVRQAEQMQPDLILLDIGLPELNGIAAARQIRTASPRSKIIIVSQERDPDLVQEAFDVGAVGYVVKTKVASKLLTAVDAALEGKRFVSGAFSV